MKIVRFLQEGKARYGIVEGGFVEPCDGDPFGGLARRQGALRLDAVRLLAPVSPPNIICLGLNYRKHADEAGLAYPAEPLIFLKATTALSGPGDPIVLPEHFDGAIDFESELAIVIGKRARNISEDEFSAVLLGYTIGNDVSNRAVQFTDGQWARAKSHDTFCPLGPAIVTDLDGDNLGISCRVDGKVMQSSSTSDMIFSCRRIVAHLSRCMTLLPGTVILTGTPEGVGFTRKPPVFLRPGQTVECAVAGIGVLANPVVGPGAGQGKA
ncbi:MAG: fumarylacetoacetate hydrolase family protein [Syntrophorhabdales bacterium]|jgi:2-keto-4-pentenoate hydratase/2-oxohepta-3-ene-1,7-dioic acid hydratase in catechol pathway